MKKIGMHFGFPARMTRLLWMSGQVLERKQLLQSLEDGAAVMAAGFGDTHPLPQKAWKILEAFQHTPPDLGAAAGPAAGPEGGQHLVAE